MPEISRFYGIVIRMYLDDHNPAFPCRVRGHEARIEIHTSALISGRPPGRALGLVAEWASLHQAELMELWGKARNLERLHKIEPLL